MPELRNQERIAVLIDMLLELLDVVDLDERDDLDTMVTLVVRRPWERSGLDSWTG